MNHKQSKAIDWPAIKVIARSHLWRGRAPPRLNLLILLIASALGSPVWAAGCAGQEGGAEAFHDLDFSYRIETLDPKSPHWTDWELAYRRTFARRTLLLGRLTQSRRFDLADTSGTVGGYLPLGAQDTLFAETTQSATHRVLPQSSYQLAWAHAFTGGWGTQFGARHVIYNSTEVTIGELTLEKYISDYRLAYSYSPSHSSTAAGAAGHRLQGGYFYGSGNSAQVIVTTGDEVDKPTSATAVTATRVNSAALFGLQWLSCDWAVGWSAAYTASRGAASSDRRGLGLFLRRRF